MVNFKMWAWRIAAYLCAILCLVIGVQGNIQKRWSDCESMEALCTKRGWAQAHPKENLPINIHAPHKLTYTRVMYVYRWASQTACTKIVVLQELEEPLGKEIHCAAGGNNIPYSTLYAGHNLLPCLHMQ